MTSEAIILWLLCLLCETFGQLIFKKAALGSDAANSKAHWKIMLSNAWIWAGISCYVIEFFSYLAFLSLVPLAQGVLLRSLSIMTIMIGGRIFFGEKLSFKRMLAGLLITIGVCLVGWS
jgi:drug/metabolite transporter (DMT)-like permease